jgi:choline dehydrogenase-like flavoprotein
MNNDPDVIIVGSGPAGVSAALPLLEAGSRVLMLDTGNGTQDNAPKGNFRTIRENDPAQWKLFLGEDFYALDSQRAPSPKMRASTHAHVFHGYESRYRITGENFTAVGSLATGGLSNVWGAGVSCLDDSELSDLPLERRELSISYRIVAERIGICGSADDDMSAFHGVDIPLQPPSPLGTGTGDLLAAYRKDPQAAYARGLRLGHARNAVLTEDLGTRQACESCGLCVWGCARKSIYSAADDVETLKRFKNFRYRQNTWVDSLGYHDRSLLVRCADMVDGNGYALTAPRVVLACGAIGTAKIVLQSLRAFDSEVRLLSNPALAFAVCLPRRLGAAVEKNAFALSQLSFAVAPLSGNGHSACGNIFGTDGLLASDFIGYLPASRRASVKIIRILAPSLLVANCFLPGEHTNHRMRLAPNGSLTIKGEYSTRLNEIARDIQPRITSSLRHYGAWVLPRSFRLISPGEDVHYAGTIPMSRSPLPHQADGNGEVTGLPGVFVVDGSALPNLSCKPPTLTIMANADRIGRRLAGLSKV